MKSKKKIVILTAYDSLMASLLEASGVDIILVGDSAGMIFAGHDTTIPVTMEDMLYHGKAVKRGTKDTFIVMDMPFMSYQASVEEALKNAGRLMKDTQANAVKLEGGEEIIPQIKALVKAGIPVMGHIGLQPQSVNIYGGYPVQGESEKEKNELIKSAKLLQEAGVFAIVLEKTKKETAKAITKSVRVPVIGIGAGKDCDGQVLVTQDMLGFFEKFSPKFVKKYENIARKIKKAVKTYALEVRTGKFPGNKNSF